MLFVCHYLHSLLFDHELYLTYCLSLIYLSTFTTVKCTEMGVEAVGSIFVLSYHLYTQCGQ